jgi:hypothetical protein
MTLEPAERTALLKEVGEQTLEAFRRMGTPEKLAAIDNPMTALIHMGVIADMRSSAVARAKLKLSAARLAKAHQ